MSRSERRTPWKLEVAERLKEAIGGEHGRQRRIAESLGIKESTLSNYLSGAAPDSWEVFRNLCAELGVGADELLGLTRIDSGAADGSVAEPDELPLPLVPMNRKERALAALLRRIVREELQRARTRGDHH